MKPIDPRENVRAAHQLAMKDKLEAQRQAELIHQAFVTLAQQTLLAINTRLDN